MEFMHSQVAERKADIRARGSDGARRDNDAFTMLVQANEDEGGKFKLDDQELVRHSHFCIICIMIDKATVDWQRLHHALRGSWYAFAFFGSWKYQHIGHTLETTAHSIAATLGFLSLNPDIQEKTYKHIISTVGHDRDPVRLYIFKLTLSLF